jgi:hypothetical protein
MGHTGSQRGVQVFPEPCHTNGNSTRKDRHLPRVSRDTYLRKPRFRTRALQPLRRRRRYVSGFRTCKGDTAETRGTTASGFCIYFKNGDRAGERPNDHDQVHQHQWAARTKPLAMFYGGPSRVSSCVDYGCRVCIFFPTRPSDLARCLQVLPNPATNPLSGESAGACNDRTMALGCCVVGQPE